MKIAILINGLPPIYNGGAEIDTYNIAKYAAKIGHEVHVIVFDSTGNGKSLYWIEGVNIHIIRIPHMPQSLKFIYWPYGLLSMTIRTIAINPSMIHAQSMILGLSAYLSNLFADIPYMVHSRGEMNVNWPFKNYIAKIVMKKAKRIIAQTNEMKDKLNHLVCCNINVVSNGIDSIKFNKIDKIVARQKLGYANAVKLIIFVGRARPEKNLLCFVKTMNCLKSKTNYYGLVIGDGVDLQHAKDMANEYQLTNIEFKGQVSNGLIPIYMSAADVLVNTSLSEGFPTTFLEAMSCGLPIIAPHICGLSEIIEEKINGLLVDPNNPISTAFAIDYILSNDVLAQKISENNIIKSANYSIPKLIDQLYGKVIGGIL